jgi:transitional endoplasmic reticulum ATPase
VSGWLLRDYHDDDLEAVVTLWQVSAITDQPPVFAMPEVVAALRSGEPAVVATAGGEVIGCVIANVSGDRAWVMRLALSPGWRHQGLGSALLAELEKRLAVAGVRRIGCLLPEGETGTVAFANSGYSSRPAISYFEKLEPMNPVQAGLLDRLGGRLLPAGLWRSMSGMEQEKRLIERRVILPLAEPERAARHGVVPPRAIILFGPPGTGKTTFARGIASRLGWPFLEVFPSRLGATAEAGLAAALRDLFAQIADLHRVLVFIDEVEEIAAARVDPGATSHVVTNELLKLIPSFREHETRLLVCATNAVGSLDPAFLRPGRFDYVLPVGPPDEVARRAIWGRYVAMGAAPEQVDLDALVAASDLFTPADIEHAARAAAQASFERDVDDSQGVGAGATSTADYLQAIAATRGTLTEQMVADFRSEIDRYART